jgi:hypothetical protein
MQVKAPKPPQTGENVFCDLEQVTGHLAPQGPPGRGERGLGSDEGSGGFDLTNLPDYAIICIVIQNNVDTGRVR